MSITYTLTKFTNNSLIELLFFGDGSSTTITVPLDLLPIALPLTKRENKPAIITSTATIPSSTAVLSVDQLSIIFTFSAPPPNGTAVDVELFYEGV